MRSRALSPRVSFEVFVQSHRVGLFLNLHPTLTPGQGPPCAMPPLPNSPEGGVLLTEPAAETLFPKGLSKLPQLSRQYFYLFTCKQYLKGTNGLCDHSDVHFLMHLIPDADTSFFKAGLELLRVNIASITYCRSGALCKARPGFLIDKA